MNGFLSGNTTLHMIASAVVLLILSGCQWGSGSSTHLEQWKKRTSLFSQPSSWNKSDFAKDAQRRKIDALVARYALMEGVPISLAKAVVRVESNYRPSARGRAGEVGLMQIKPSTARGMGYRGSVRGLYDPETNIRWGMKYLGQARRLARGDTCGTAMRYNAGLAARRLNHRTNRYCSAVKRHM